MITIFLIAMAWTLVVTTANRRAYRLPRNRDFVDLDFRDAKSRAWRN